MNIAYFAVHPTTDEQGYIGAVLVINETYVPQEFRCTYPVRPSSVQNALYGHTLKPYLFNELLGVSLARAITSNPSAFMVENAMLLQLREHLESPLLHLEELGESLSVHSSSAAKTLNRTHRIEGYHGGFKPVSAMTQVGYEGDYEKIKEDLEQMANYVDLLEPFERITTALNVLRERDDRFK